MKQKTYTSKSTLIASCLFLMSIGLTMTASANPITPPVAGFNATNVCDGNAVQFNNTSDPGSIPATPVYTWDFGDGNGSADVNPSHTYAAPGTYTVSLTIAMEDFYNPLETDVVTHDVTVYSVPDSKPGTPGTITGSTDICQGSTQFYSIAPVPTANSYTWSTTGGFIIVSGQGTTTVEVSAPIGVTSGDIRVRANNCKGSSSDRSKSIKGKTLPAPPNSINGPTSVCTNKSISYKIQGTSSGTTYVWDITGLPAMVNNLNENKEAKITFLAPGTALVKTYSINVCGLAGPTTKTVTVNNCNRMIDDAANAAQISVYPNPVKDLLNLKFQSEQNQTYMIRLMDITGRVVYFESNSAVEGENKTEINLSGFASGIYMLNLQSNESNQQIRVMVE